MTIVYNGRIAFKIEVLCIPGAFPDFSAKLEAVGDQGGAIRTFPFFQSWAYQPQPDLQAERRLAMQTNGRKQRIIIQEGTGNPPIDDMYHQIDELGEDWRLVSATTTSETVSGKLPVTGRTYRRYCITAVVEKRNA